MSIGSERVASGEQRARRASAGSSRAALAVANRCCRAGLRSVVAGGALLLRSPRRRAEWRRQRHWAGFKVAPRPPGLPAVLAPAMLPALICRRPRAACQRAGPPMGHQASRAFQRKHPQRPETEIPSLPRLKVVLRN